MRKDKYLRKRLMNKDVEDLIKKGYVSRCPRCGGEKIKFCGENRMAKMDCLTCNLHIETSFEENLDPIELKRRMLKHWNELCSDPELSLSFRNLANFVTREDMKNDKKVSKKEPCKKNCATCSCKKENASKKTQIKNNIKTDIDNLGHLEEVRDVIESFCKNRKKRLERIRNIIEKRRQNDVLKRNIIEKKEYLSHLKNDSKELHDHINTCEKKFQSRIDMYEKNNMAMLADIKKLLLAHNDFLTVISDSLDKLVKMKEKTRNQMFGLHKRGYFN